MKKQTILLIDDDPSLRRVIEYSLVESGYSVLRRQAGGGDCALPERALRRGDHDITMPGMSGLDVLVKVRQADQNVPVIIITAYGTIESAVSAMKQGAFDYITKPFNREELRITLERALRMRRLEKENVRLRAEVIDRYRSTALSATARSCVRSSPSRGASPRAMPRSS